ncbi:hypothetical protein PIB30_075010 [Stylosanthes scabra]|uniref:Uncharacterized protein n=1 Tax=Stylosanthes scabra TaxID=79078 RepID=A0ABU6ZNK5_9FABA|nr:hypothetical protein [Stylosanthes scabra]
MPKKKNHEPTSREKGKKNQAPNVEENKSIKRPNKRSDSRCTPLKFRKIYDKLSLEKKQLVDEMGLGAFAHLPDFYINHKLLIELVRSYDIFSSTICTRVG